ncbi:MAG: hypothetical protein IJF27_02730 [Oscillospiraceae bacterium]|nr:hypothetical protein [Oscillospiraceae bacterium]
MSDNFEKLVQGFKKPALEYSPVVMWFWNGRMDEKNITFQLEKFREQNITDFFIHYSPGCDVEYLTDEHMELIKHVVKEAKRLGMHYWIYDEYEYPSGTCGGLILEKDPKYAQQEICCVARYLNPCGMRETAMKRGTFVGAQSIKTVDGKYSVVDVTDKCEVTQGEEFAYVEYQNNYSVPEKILFFFVTKNESSMPSTDCCPNAKGVPGYLNIINKEAVAEFLRMTIDTHKKAVGEEFGKTVKGIFTDEPTSLRHFSCHLPGPWDDGMFEMFEEMFGYSLKPYLYALFYEPKSPEDSKARDDYRSLIKKLYLENFVAQYAECCEKNNLIFTGHFGGEEDMLGSVYQGNFQTALSYMGIPGMDCIFPTYKYDEDRWNIAGKLVSSVAKYKNVDRVLCETFTGSGWNTDFTHMRRIVNRLLVMGANMIQYMGAHYSLRESRKKDMLPSSHSYINPLFKFYNIYNEYVAALSYLSAKTRPDGKIMLISPLRQCIQENDVMDNEVHYATMPVQIVYQNAVNALAWGGMGFDIFSEDEIDKITYHDGYMEAFGYKFEYIVLPSMKYIDKIMADALNKMKAHGIKIVFMNFIPESIVEAAEKVNFEFNGKPFNGYDNVYRDGNVYFIDSTSAELYNKVIKEIIPETELHIESDTRIYVGPRKNGDVKLWFLCNDENKDAVAYIDSVPGIKLFNTTTKEEVTCYDVENGRIKLTFAPYEMIVAIQDLNSTEEYVCCKVEYTESVDYVLTSMMEFQAVGGNMLPMKKYEVFDEELQEWREGDGLVDLPEGMHLPRSTMYKIRGEVNFEYIPDRVYINAEVLSLKSLKLNGNELEKTANTHRWSEEDMRLDVTKYIKHGKNIIEMDVMSDSVYVTERIPFIFFSGDFGVNDKNAAVPVSRFIRPGGWEKQGYPYFCGDGIYSMDVGMFGMDKGNFCRPWKKAVLKIDSTLSAEVWVNGKKMGSNIWKPGEVDITDALHDMANDITVKLTSTYSNLFAGIATPADRPFDTYTVNGLNKPLVITLYN